MKASLWVTFLFLLQSWAFAQPQVNPDLTVTFRIDAPKAERVLLEGDILTELYGRRGETPPQAIPLSKEEDGVWSVTVGPLEPNPYLYTIQIDGRGGPDPFNFNTFTGQRFRKSMVLVHTSDNSGIWEFRDVAHGTVHRHTYYSPTAEDVRELYVYTPAGYESGIDRYPVLYLLHGRGERADSWLVAGCADRIADNLIAEGRAVPMIIVMPFGRAVPKNTPDQLVADRLIPDLERDILTTIIPLVEKAYRVHADRANRAIAGFSLGGAQAGAIGLGRLEVFSSVGVFSAGLLDFEKEHPDLIDRPAETNRALRYLLLAAGSNDTIGPGGSAIEGQRTPSALLNKKGIEHSFYELPGAGHTWYAWRHYLSEKLLLRWSSASGRSAQRKSTAVRGPTGLSPTACSKSPAR